MMGIKALWHFAFGHGKSYIEQHQFRVGADSSGVLSCCLECQQTWFEWVDCDISDLLVSMSESSEGLLKYVGEVPTEEEAS